MAGGGGREMGSDTCRRYKRLAVSGWEHNRDRGESKLREMKSDPISLVCVDFYYDFARQNAGLLMYCYPLR